MDDQMVPIEAQVEDARKQIDELARYVLRMKNHPFFKGKTDGVANHGEMIANIMLAYRHLEDARMRLGKVYQAKDGGKSVYDK